ncbi:single-stranded-DNA-specific exonuclease RecJ [Natroniella acetigena]|uniref:single-stranded-DNA-specific exonuclease RecJ n=1 Tax=Natroniella acetigena TaxID=52004 RepID=UPI00200B29D7|nr:single-stranded-DNA-specific exonuclease RecJ [Natroniella acetigena]MCK8827560.1 single-stranded-DNA-specific exonuclease RecJ [Natroniella acetigena]
MLSKRGAKWKVKDGEQEIIDRLIKELELDPVIAKILVNRGLKTPQQVEEFLDFDLEKLNDPFLLPDIKQAIARIKVAIKNNEQIVIYGDYDVDGITATSLLVDYLKKLGAKVDYYIPNRLEEGYGLNLTAVELLADKGTDLIITVDCGIKAHQQIKYANQLGLDLIITDHHQVPNQLPNAVAIINPKRDDSSYSFAELAGVGVAFKLVSALELEVKENDDLKILCAEYLDLVALGTVADIVPLVGENRILVKHGLSKIKNTAKLGLAALVEVSQLTDKEINTGRVGYNLAPKINAAGRIGNPTLAVELLLAQEESEARNLAKELKQLNEQRQQISQQMFEEAEVVIKQLNLEEEWFLVLASPDWHPGIAGNVASDICEKYHRPTILISQDSTGKWQGSGRSIKGFDIHEALLNNQQLLERFGGHKQAAGLTITEENIKKLRANLNSYIQQKLEASDLIPVLKIDAEVKFDQLDFSLVNKLEQLAPFGLRNPRPILASKDVEVKSFRAVGKSNKHLKLTVSSAGEVIDAIAFNQAELETDLIEQKQELELLFNVEINQWQGNSSLQLKVKDFKIPQTDFVTEMFVKGRRADAVQTARTENFYTEFIKPSSEISSQKIKSLSIGDKLLLTSKVDTSLIKVLTPEQEIIGHLSEKLSGQLTPFLIVGINYNIVVSQIIDNNNGLQVKLFIYQAKDKHQEIKARLESEQQNLAEVRKNITAPSFVDSQQEKIYDHLINEQNTLAVWPAGQVNLATLAEVLASKVIKFDQIVVVVLPFQRLVAQRYRFLKHQLSSGGLKIFKGYSSLNLVEKEELKSRLNTGQLDLLLVTPEFVEAYLEDLGKIKNEVGLLAIDYNFELNSSPSQFQQLQQTVLKLRALFNNPLVLALMTELKIELKEKLISELKIAQIEVVDAEPTKFQLLDKRNYSDKVGYTNQVINQEGKKIIYVKQQQESIDFAVKLRINNPQLATKIMYYHSALTTAEKNRIKDKFQVGEIEVVVATEPLSLTGGIRGVNHIIFVQPPFNQFEFNDYIAQVTNSEDQLAAHLLYQEQDLENNQFLLEEINPGRELLAQLYILLVKESNEQGEVVVTEQELVALLLQKVEQNITVDTILAGLDIFMELQLLSIIKQEQSKIRIKLHPQPEAKLDLTSSMRYNEGVKEKKRFKVFKERFLAKRVEKLSNLIK